MATLKLKYKSERTEDGGFLDTIDLKSFNSFGPSVLGLGDISKQGEYQQALVAFFDLEGFTNFTNQIDPHLVIPEFLNSFIEWLFNSISREVQSKQKDNIMFVWCPLPIFAKFMGDGVLFLWDTSSFGEKQYGNLILSLSNICLSYNYDFLSRVGKSVSKPPTRLRCGVARGQVISIGNGNDFVGACINVAARLQKLNKFSFAFSKRGFNLQKNFSETGALRYSLIQTDIRGVGENELVYILAREYQELGDVERPKLIA